MVRPTQKGRDPTSADLRRPLLSFRLRASYTALRLACPLDFLVRVSRRVEKAPGQVDRPRAPERRSGLSRPHERAGTEYSPRTPYERESGGSSPSPEGRAGAETVSTFLDLVTHANGETVSSLKARRPSELPAFAAFNGPINGRSSTPEAREKCARRAAASTRPARVPEGNPQTVRGAEASPCAESPGHGVRGLSVYFSAASRPIELSLQSSFQLSLMVLVFYRSRASI